MRIDAKKIKQLMVRDDLKQKDVAERLGVHPTAFSFALSSGTTTTNIAMRLAVMLNVPFSEISDDPDVNIQQDPANNPELLKKMYEIILGNFGLRDLEKSQVNIILCIYSRRLLS